MQKSSFLDQLREEEVLAYPLHSRKNCTVFIYQHIGQNCRQVYFKDSVKSCL